MPPCENFRYPCTVANHQRRRSTKCNVDSFWML
eukprot:CAMPEP_0176049704 /NCGR_PEP_ID=MMETSP0120_2-20121206/24699_1 /TAXON_ID=160619 /ORGANISM="Kryptoperidinium foliaceum, Strain CCMP 1326" /LENGTH=32 /DNA_ID= /DNA_START= /DNA_END= /DNA_ORIENTATION=